MTAAHMAAEMGHVDALEVLHQACCMQRQSCLWAGSGSEVALTSLIVQACYVRFLLCPTWELVNRLRKRTNHTTQPPSVHRLVRSERFNGLRFDTCSAGPFGPFGC